MANMTNTQGFALSFTKVSEALGRYEGTFRNVEDLLALLQLAPPGDILDVACGGGRYAGAFHRLGYHVTAIDLSSEQVAYARESNPGPNYLVGDMRAPPQGPYDLVLNAYSSFGYFETEAEDQQALAAWCQCLKPDGHLVMELSDLERARARYGSSREPFVVERDGARESYLMDWEASILLITQEVRDVGCLVSRKRLYATERLIELLRAAGFGTIQVFGSYGGAPKRPQDRAVIFARPRAA